MKIVASLKNYCVKHYTTENAGLSKCQCLFGKTSQVLPKK